MIIIIMMIVTIDRIVIVREGVQGDPEVEVQGEPEVQEGSKEKEIITIVDQERNMIDTETTNQAETKKDIVIKTDLEIMTVIESDVGMVIGLKMKFMMMTELKK